MAGSNQDFEEFVAAHHRALLKFGRLLAGDWHTGEDLLQTALVKVHRRWRRADAVEAPLAYTKRVMVTTCSSWRSRRWRGEIPSAALPDRPWDDGDRSRIEARDLLARCLAGLPVDQRVVLVLRFYEDLTLQETAELLGCAQGTVKSRTNRALRALRADGALDHHRILEEK